MCEPKSAGIMPGFLIGRGQKAQRCTCPTPRKTTGEKFNEATDTAGKWVVGIAAMVVISAIGGGAVSTAVGWTLGVVKIGLGVAAGLIVVAVVVTVIKRVRKHWQPNYIPAPLPAPSRTTVTGVSVQAITGPTATASAGPTPSTAAVQRRGHH